MDSTAANLEEGKVLANRYKVEKVLGQGGMGAVYLARDGSLGDKAVAIKEMRVSAADDKGQQAALQQFRQEAQFLANLEHPNLVQVSDFFSEGGRHYLVMAYVKGQNLGEMLLARKGAFPVAKVLEWGRQLAAVLHYLHSQEPPILFRDLKPSNIMEDAAGNIRLIDFGIARSFHPQGVTATFLQGMGSAGYSPLEQYQGAGGTDPRSDIYALGATLFHLITNRVPPSPVELVSENQPMPSPRRWNPTLPGNIEQILLKMLAVRKDDRYQTMEQVRALLDQAARNLQQDDDDTEALGRAPGPPPPTLAQAPTASLEPDPNSGLLYMILGMLTMAAVGLFAFLAYQATHASPGRTPAPLAAASSPAPSATKAPPKNPRPEKTRQPLAVNHSRPTTPPPAPAPTRQPVVQRPAQVERPRLPGASYPGAVPTARPRSRPTPTPLPELPEPVVLDTPAASPPPPSNSEDTGLATRGKKFKWPSQGVIYREMRGWVYYGPSKGWVWTGPVPGPPTPPQPAEDGSVTGPFGLAWPRALH
ncbi:MAG: serine/threonine protein kinase [Candidatus Eremiobacteraeota bacterium]|nr:serine/threonine protein kinase [Candidatus Eremiobacteraeota bacterium]MCW5867720.1 serine/threonine protein kinase [Candidatus Eremiobacteraeota bacterium]